MIEALAIVFVVVISLGIYLLARVGAQDGSKRDLLTELNELKQHRETLREKALRGKREHWDHVMMSQLAHRLDQVEHQIAQKTGEGQSQAAG